MSIAEGKTRIRYRRQPPTRKKSLILMSNEDPEPDRTLAVSFLLPCALSPFVSPSKWIPPKLTGER